MARKWLLARRRIAGRPPWMMPDLPSGRLSPWTVHGGVLRASGDTRSPLIFGATAMWLAVLLSWVLVTFFDGQLWMVWLTFFVTTPIPAIMNWVRFRNRMRRAEQDLVSSMPSLMA